MGSELPFEVQIALPSFKTGWRFAALTHITRPIHTRRTHIFQVWGICAMVKRRYIGDGRPPTFNRNPYNGYINPYGIGLMTIPYYMETMGV